MSYQALYRKYRSQTFSEMVGQENVSLALRNEIKTGKISHAYLFSGPRGTGKTSAAKIFAKAVNCPNQVDGEPCNQCAICQSITNGTFDDVLEIDAASNNGVDEIREIRDKVNYAATQGEYKVYIIDEVHMLSSGAFNALLKTLEEPPENVVFILATTELHKVPATILSRVERFQFRSIKPSDIAQHLVSILSENEIPFSDEAVWLIATSAAGGMRDALSTLDQALSLDANHLTVENALIVSGMVSNQLKDSYVAAILAQNAEVGLNTLERLYEEGIQVNRFLDELLAYFRDLLLYQKAAQLITTPTQQFIENAQVTSERLFAAIEKIIKASEAMRFSSQAKLLLEVLTITLSEGSSRTTPIDNQLLAAMQEEIAALKREVATLKQSKKSSVQPVITQQASASKTPVATISKDELIKVLNEAEKQRLVDIKRVWHEFLEHLSPIQRALLNASNPVAASQAGVILDFSEEILAQKAMANENLLLEFENVMSNLVGFSPRLLAIGHDNWLPIRDQFRAQFRANKQNQDEEKIQPNQSSEVVDEKRLQFIDEARELFGAAVKVVGEDHNSN
ncbi:MAG: DNA polymerase III subunit gamma/tau [Streptococcaceae bacterium]|jgi:DNA polymerase-3 subunit gamma/tau|nr:DNA polymerase III subunit gamma/tau [Streptococcaceae bacterium]